MDLWLVEKGTTQHLISAESEKEAREIIAKQTRNDLWADREQTKCIRLRPLQIDLI